MPSDWEIRPRTRCGSRVQCPRRIEKAVASRVGFARTHAAHDIFNVAAADADIAQLMIRELRQFAHRVSIAAPSVELLRDHFEGDHLSTPFLTPRGVSKVRRHQKE